MKPNNKIHIFFIAVALAFWNPLSLYFIYRGTAVTNSKIINLLFWIILFLGIINIILISKDKINKGLKNIVFSFAFAGIVFSVFVLIDSGIGFFLPEENKPSLTTKGLIFEPNSKARYKTVEFDYTAEINSLGLRDREIEIDKGDKYRILCFGDSWTFGWGVNVENSWPKKLEEFLKKKGYDYIEVINCGRGGQYTSSYKKYLGKAVPLLKPDLVLVGVLQSDDLAQLYENNFNNENNFNKLSLISKLSKVTIQQLILKIKFSLKTFLKESFKHFLLLIKSTHSEIVEVKSNWRSSAISMINSFNRLQTLRFNTFDGSAKELFKTGNLNPGLLNYYINFPDRHLIFNDPMNNATLFAITEMKKDFEDMQSICKENSTGLIFINLPINYFTGHEVTRIPIDYYINDYLYYNNKIDSIYRSIAGHVNIPYLELTNRFKQLADKSAYFFKYDGHPNEKGYKEIANGIGKYLINEHLTIIKNK